MRIRKTMVVFWLAVALSGSLPATDKIHVVASTPDLEAIAQEIGGDLIEVESIAHDGQDPHFVELLPSYMVRVRKADLYLKVGMDLDYWAQLIIDGSRNAKLAVVDCASYLPAERRLEVPTHPNPSMGDIHRYGNPHYWLDPANGKLIAKAIAEGLGDVDPVHHETYEANLSAFSSKLDGKIVEWTKKTEPLRGMKIVTYHNTWPYFTRAFGIDVVNWLEPKPGVKPSPQHVSDLIEEIRAKHVAAVAYEPYYEARTPKLIARETGVPLLILPPSVGGVPEVRNYFQLFDYNLDALLRARQGTTSP